jgi:hypothetical protein
LAKVFMTLINWLLKLKCMIKYMYIFLKFSLLYKKAIWFFRLWETWLHAQKYIFFFFWQKLDIFNDVKIQSILIENNITSAPGNCKNPKPYFWKGFLYKKRKKWASPAPILNWAYKAGLNLAAWAGLMFQPTSQETGSCAQ